MAPASPTTSGGFIWNDGRGNGDALTEAALHVDFVTRWSCMSGDIKHMRFNLSRPGCPEGQRE